MSELGGASAGSMHFLPLGVLVRGCEDGRWCWIEWVSWIGGCRGCTISAGCYDAFGYQIAYVWVDERRRVNMVGWCMGHIRDCGWATAKVVKELIWEERVKVREPQAHPETGLRDACRERGQLTCSTERVSGKKNRAYIHQSHSGTIQRRFC